jgi:CHAD domain-containing protein
MPEALHQLRVALRRLRSALILFRPVLRRSRRYRRLSNELRRCGRTLGDARNLDVLLTMIDCRFAAVDEVKRARELSYDRVIAMLGSRRFLGMMLGLVRWVLIGKWRRRPDSMIPLQSFSDWRLETAWAKLSRQRMSLSRMTDRQRHRLRVRSKEFRYAIEFLRSINPKPKEQRKAFHAALEALQEDLGQLNDVAHAKRLAAANGCSLRALSPEQSPEAVLDKAEKEYSDLLAIGPYWRREAT